MAYAFMLAFAVLAILFGLLTAASDWAPLVFLRVIGYVAVALLVVYLVRRADANSRERA